MRKTVFLSCHPNMWEGFETLWDQETADPMNQVSVIPIPTYSKDKEGKLCNPVYITEGYPECIQLCTLNDYNIAAEHPDRIYIQNIQDNDNPAFGLDPSFYTSNLSRITKELIYVPYNCMSEVSPEYEQLEKNYLPILTPPGILNVDHVIIQSENMKNVYLKLLSIQGESVEKWNAKISYENYPRKKVLQKYTWENIQYPEKWDQYLWHSDGSAKNTILVVSSVMGLLEFGRDNLKKIKALFEYYIDKKNETALIWRPHRNLPDVIMRFRPELFDAFRSLLEFYIYNNVGIFDETPTPTPAIIMSDSYIGDECGAKELFASTGKLVSIL